MSMREVVVREARPADIAALGLALRAQDAAEIEAAGLRPGKALWRSYRGSIFSKAAFVGGELAAIWGMGGCPMGKIGEPWLLTAPPIERAKVAIVKVGRAEVAEMLSICPRLMGWVDSRYEGAVRLLEILGFDLDNPLPFGANGAPFRKYRMERPN